MTGLESTVVVGVIRVLRPIVKTSREQSHKVDRIRVGSIRTFSFILIPFMTPSCMIQWKLNCQNRKQKLKNQPITRPGNECCDWFALPLLLPTLTMSFSLDHKWQSHKGMRCSASNSVGLIFTRSHHSGLLIMTPTMTPLQVKTRL